MPVYRSNPDYAVPPGWVLEERLEAHSISIAVFARRCGRSPELIRGIVSGEAPLDRDTALQFERVLEVSANIWLGLEANYRKKLARDAEKNAAWNSRTRLFRFLRRALSRANDSPFSISNGYCAKADRSSSKWPGSGSRAKFRNRSAELQEGNVASKSTLR